MGNNLYIQPDQLKQFLDDIPKLKVRKMDHKRIRLMFEVLLYGGMRISEVLQITPKMLVNGKIKLEVTKGGIKRCKCSKWEFRPMKLVSSNPNCSKCHGIGKYRVPVDAWVQEEVYKDLLEFSKNFKVDERIFPISRSWAWHWCNILMQGRTHTFRHTFLTWLIDSGNFTVKDIMQKARHKSLQVTTVYIEKNPDLVQAKENKFIERI